MSHDAGKAPHRDHAHQLLSLLSLPSYSTPYPFNPPTTPLVKSLSLPTIITTIIPNQRLLTLTVQPTPHLLRSLIIQYQTLPSLFTKTPTYSLTDSRIAPNLHLVAFKFKLLHQQWNGEFRVLKGSRSFRGESISSFLSS